MTVIVEDGSTVANANSYITGAEVVDYAAARGVTILLADTEELIVKSMDYTEGLAFKGVKVTSTQALQWPRASVYVDSYLVGTDEIPSELTKGQLETCLSISNNEDPLANVARVQESVSVGSLSVKYASGSSTTLVKKISNAFKKLLTSSGGATFEVSR